MILPIGKPSSLEMSSFMRRFSHITRNPPQSHAPNQNTVIRPFLQPNYMDFLDTPNPTISQPDCHDEPAPQPYHSDTDCEINQNLHDDPDTPETENLPNSPEIMPIPQPEPPIHQPEPPIPQPEPIPQLRRSTRTRITTAPFS